jgi:hypothetical protein
VPWPLLLPRSEHSKLPTAKAFKLAERDKHMSEQKVNYMQELDLWTEANILKPAATPGEDTGHKIKFAIREKVLESYKNGLRAGAGAVRKEMKQLQK